VVKYLQVTDEGRVVLVPYNYAQFGYFPRVKLHNLPSDQCRRHSLAMKQTEVEMKSECDTKSEGEAKEREEEEELSQLSSKEVFRRLRLDSETVLLQSLHNDKLLTTDRFARPRS
jgi:hypothetical protein